MPKDVIDLNKSKLVTGYYILIPDGTLAIIPKRDAEVLTVKIYADHVGGKWGYIVDNRLA